MLPILPVPPTASCVPSGEKASDRTPPIECSRCTLSQVYMTGASHEPSSLPDLVSHTTTCATLSPVARYLQSWEDVRAWSIEQQWFGVISLCPFSSWTTLPVAAFHTRQTMSSATLATSLPLGDATTLRIHLACASIVRIVRPVVMSHQTSLPS